MDIVLVDALLDQIGKGKTDNIFISTAFGTVATLVGSKFEKLVFQF